CHPPSTHQNFTQPCKDPLRLQGCLPVWGSAPPLYHHRLRTTPVSSIDVNTYPTLHKTLQESFLLLELSRQTTTSSRVEPCEILGEERSKMPTPLDRALNSKNLFLGFTALVTAATAWSIWGQDMFPKEPDPTGEPETWTDTEMRSHERRASRESQGKYEGTESLESSAFLIELRRMRVITSHERKNIPLDQIMDEIPYYEHRMQLNDFDQ
ncbi:hypothetical protein AC578_8205, partial [Pseudocercospora eumusae]